MQEMRDAMAADERSAAFVAAMRATNLNDDDVAAAHTAPPADTIMLRTPETRSSASNNGTLAGRHASWPSKGARPVLPLPL